jgi:hypothetical protein
MALAKGSDLSIENESRPITIKVWEQSKVKVTTKLSYKGDGSTLTDEDWFEKLNISLKNFGGGVRLLSKGVSGSYYSYSGGSGNNVAIFNSEGKSSGTVKGKREIVVYIPKDCKLDIDSKYGNVKITGTVASAKALMNSCSLELENADRLYARSKYGNIAMGNVKDAELEVSSGRIKAAGIDVLSADTKYSNVEITSLGKGTIKSVSDDYDLDAVSTIQGRKNYGSLRIGSLKKSIDMEGSSSDIKIRTLETSIEEVKINSAYSDIRVPADNLKNYSVDMQGKYNTVYASFDKIPVDDEVKTATDTKGEKGEKGDKGSKGGETYTINGDKVTINSVRLNGGGDGAPKHFTAKVGDGKGTKFNITCSSCTVDFK